MRMRRAVELIRSRCTELDKLQRQTVRQHPSALMPCALIQPGSGTTASLLHAAD
jgi:hypothetical protein